MMYDTEPPTTRLLLERIAAILNVPTSAFLACDELGLVATEPTPAECEQVAILYRRIADPQRRAVLVKLLRDMAEQG